MPFLKVHSWFGKKKASYYEQDVTFLFRFVTLGIIAEEMDIEIYELFDRTTLSDKEVSSVLIWAGYLSACQKNYTKPVYTKKDAEFWNEYMSTTSRQEITKQFTELLGKLQKGKEGEGVKKK